MLERLIGRRQARYPLSVEPLPITELAMPLRLSFSLAEDEQNSFSLMVAEGNDIQPGLPLAANKAGGFLLGLVKGRVAAITTAPGIRGALEERVILVEPVADTNPIAFAPLDPDSDPVPDLLNRIRQASVFTDSLRPVPLCDLLVAEEGAGIDTMVVLAADREPEVRASLQLFRERPEDAFDALRLLARISGASEGKLAVPETAAAEASRLADGQDAAIMSLPAEYPHTLEPLVARRTADSARTRVIAVETALAALDAVRHGRVQDKKVLTVIGPDGKARGNFRVQIGTRLKDLLPQCGLGLNERDKVVAGGPMRGFAQFSLDTAVDAGVDAIMVIPADAVRNWTDDPCVNCGECLEVCPTNLQAHMLGRYAEFGFFDRAEDLEIAHCIECGLCGLVCTAGRPLLQYHRLAKKEIEKRKADLDKLALDDETKATASDPEPESELGQ